MCRMGKLGTLPLKVLHRISIVGDIETNSSSDIFKSKSVRKCWDRKVEIDMKPGDSKKKIENKPEEICIERDTMLWHNVVEVRVNKTKTHKKCLHRVVSAYAKHHNKWFMTDKNAVQRSGCSPENKKKYRLEIRMIKKSSLSGYADSVMSNKTHC